MTKRSGTTARIVLLIGCGSRIVGGLNEEATLFLRKGIEMADAKCVLDVGRPYGVEG